MERFPISYFFHHEVFAEHFSYSIVITKVGDYQYRSIYRMYPIQTIDNLELINESVFKYYKFV